MVNNQFSNLIFSITFFEVMKWLLVGGLILYTAFAAIIIRQVAVMSEAVEDSVNILVQMFAWAHLALAVFLVIVAIVIL